MWLQTHSTFNLTTKRTVSPPIPSKKKKKLKKEKKWYSSLLPKAKGKNITQKTGKKLWRKLADADAIVTLSKAITHPETVITTMPANIKRLVGSWIGRQTAWPLKWLSSFWQIDISSGEYIWHLFLHPMKSDQLGMKFENVKYIN